jgi:2-polyprenyl-6-methoxyphenol hydroxylase-like FAD-dependent oxidoreductase
MRVAVAGGGIAGLTAAIALAARGFSVALFERAQKLEEIGAGIQLSPNAMAVLERLGVARALEGRLSEPEALVVRSGRSGRAIATLPLGKAARERYGAPYCTLHRADLQSALLATARRSPSISFHLGAEVHDVRTAEAGIVFTAGGLARKASVLVGADGVNSRVRASYFGHPGSQSLGRNAWRAILPATSAAGLVPLDVTGLWLGAGAHLVHYPVRSGESLNVVAIARSDEAKPPREQFGPAAQRLIEAVSEWTPWPLLHLDAARPWARGRVALVGDAAHAMAPSAAQGGAQAIEDAWVLAKALSENKAEPDQALTKFERARRPRVARVAEESRRNLNTYEMRGAPAVARNLVLRALPASLLISRLDWLFGWKPE